METITLTGLFGGLLILVSIIGILIIEYKKSKIPPYYRKLDNETRILKIESWEMLLDNEFSICHGVEDFKKIVNIDVIIKNDIDISFNFSSFKGAAFIIDKSKIVLSINDNDFFKNDFFPQAFTVSGHIILTIDNR
jgi:hypothetical protein